MNALTSLHVYVRELNILLSAEIERLTENMSFGNAESFEEYKHTAGKIAGLRHAIECIDEADRICREKYL